MLSTYKEKVTHLRVKRELLSEQLSSGLKSCEVLREDLKNYEEARELFQAAANATQKQLEFKLGDVVSKAMAAVWDDPYRFKVDFVTRRGSTECDLLFEREGKTMKPFDSSGYGAADIASLALRVSYWSNNRTRPCLIFDEPCRQLSADKSARASLVFKQLSDSLHLQFILVSHNEGITSKADRVINIEKSGGISRVTQ